MNQTSDIKIYFINKPHYELGEFQYPDGTYKDEHITVASSRYFNAQQFEEEIEHKKSSFGVNELFIYEYVVRTDRDLEGNDFSMLWVRCAFKKSK